jgi:carboxymethylenebutenolidase
MMHGRGGAYSPDAHDNYDATTLEKRHQLWGQIWAQHGYIAILVDGFGPRGGNVAHLAGYQFPNARHRLSSRTRAIST